MTKFKFNTDCIVQKTNEGIIVFSMESFESYTLNETAALIVNYLERGWSKVKIKKKFIDIYPAVKEQEIGADIDQTIKYLLKRGIIVVD